MTAPTFAGKPMTQTQFGWDYSSGPVAVHVYRLELCAEVLLHNHLCPRHFRGTPQACADAARDWMSATGKALLEAAGESV